MEEVAVDSIVVVGVLLMPAVEAHLVTADDVTDRTPVVMSPPTLAVLELEIVADVSVADAAVNADKVGDRPGARGSVSSSKRSDCWKRIWRAGPTVNLPSRLVAPQTPPRKSVASVVHV